MGERTPYTIGVAVPADAEPLGRLHCRVWRTTYAGLMPAEQLARLDPERFVANWQGRLAASDADGLGPDGDRVLIGRHESDGVVGFISVGPPREDEAPVGRQLWAINLDAAHQGTGLAQRLLDEGLGVRPAYLWVARGNDRAIAFYERNGFAVDGATQTDPGHGDLVELRMVRR